MEDAYLGEKIARLQWLLHRQKLRGFINAASPTADPTRGQGRILAILKLRDGVSARELSFLLGIRVSSLNELLAKLERGEFIKREPSEEDRRVMLAWLTDKGRAEEQCVVGSNDNEIFACLSEGEQVSFGEYLERIIIALEEQLGDANLGDDFDWEALHERVGRRMEHLITHHRKDFTREN